MFTLAVGFTMTLSLSGVWVFTILHTPKPRTRLMYYVRQSLDEGSDRNKMVFMPLLTCYTPFPLA